MQSIYFLHHHRGLCRLPQWVFGAAISGGRSAISVGPVAACPVFLKYQGFVIGLVTHLRSRSNITRNIKFKYIKHYIPYGINQTHRISHTYIQFMAIGHINLVASAKLLTFSSTDGNLPPDFTFRLVDIHWKF